MNLPPVHGYGVPQILSQWQAGQNRRQRKEEFNKEFKLREDQFKLQEEKFAAEKTQKENLRKSEASKKAFSFIDVGDKYIKSGNVELGMKMNKQGYSILNQVFPDLNIDLSKVINPEEIKEVADKQILNSLTELHTKAISGDKQAQQQMPGALAAASYAKIDKTTLEHLSDYMPEKDTGDVENQKKVKLLKEAYPNLDDQTIAKLAAGTIKIKTDPVSGGHTSVDLGTGVETQLKQGSLPDTPQEGDKPEEKPKEQGEDTIFDLADFVSGPGSAAKSALSIPSGLVGGPVASKTIQARQYVTTTKNDLIRALSINPRFPVGEIKRIEKEIDIQPKILDNPQMFRDRLIAIDKYLRRRVEKEKSIGDNTKMPASKRRDALSAAADIENFIKLMGVPQSIKTIEDYNALEQGVKYIDPSGKLRKKGNK